MLKINEKMEQKDRRRKLLELLKQIEDSANDKGSLIEGFSLSFNNQIETVPSRHSGFLVTKQTGYGSLILTVNYAPAPKVPVQFVPPRVSIRNTWGFKDKTKKRRKRKILRNAPRRDPRP